MATFSWIQYSFTGGFSPVPEAQYYQLRQFSPPELEEIILGIRQERWKQFRQDQKFLLYFVYAAPVCFVLGMLFPLFHLGTLWGFVSLLSVGVSAMSFNSALHKQCRFFRRTYELC